MKRSTIKKEVAEWVAIISIIGIIYFGGWHTEIIGRLQQAVLVTGMISPNYVEEEKTISYDFSLENLKGDKVYFDSFKGEVVFLNFWATWCPPCIAEMPDIQALYDSEKSNIAFVMVSLDKDKEKAREFIERKNFDFPVYFLNSSLPDTYDIHSIPTTYVIDKQGLVRVENHGMAKYNTKQVKSLMKELNETE